MQEEKTTKQADKLITIDLKSPQGNAFYLLGLAQNYGKKLGYNKAQLDELFKDMQSADYEHLIEVFEQHFNTIIELKK